jgi:uridine kinase
MPGLVPERGPRTALIADLAGRIVAVKRPHPLRVAIDGVDAAGKTTLADELAEVIRARGRPVIRASVDSFHRPRVERQRRGALSPEGYYHDSFDYPALLMSLLVPLGPDGSRRYCGAAFDHRTDARVHLPVEVAPVDAVLLVDGVFLLRPELVHQWEYRVFVDVAFSTVLDRAVERDRALFGSAAVVEERYRRRYIPGQQIYLAEARPHERADMIVHNDDPGKPRLSPPPGQQP